MLVTGGHPFYGQPLGVLLLPVQSPALPGNVGNAYSFDYPVRYKVMKDISPDWWVDSEGPSEARFKKFIIAARELEDEGVKAITVGCGFFGIYQKRAAEVLRVPIFTSPLMMVPLVHQMLGGKQIGILTIKATDLNDQLFEAVGITPDIPVVIGELGDAPEFNSVYVKGNKSYLDLAQFEAEVVAAARRMQTANPGLGAVVFEFRTICPFASAVSNATELPVFDLMALADFVHHAAVPPIYQGRV
ncbi:MAG: hypothetical protein AAGU27_18495 [Dehalobacterium sp.]